MAGASLPPRLGRAVELALVEREAADHRQHAAPRCALADRQLGERQHIYPIDQRGQDDQIHIDSLGEETGQQRREQCRLHRVLWSVEAQHVYPGGGWGL